MDSGVVHSRVHEYDERHPHNVGLQEVARDGAEEHQHDHEKKSVLKKVKAKAKRIKDTIKKHGHHDHDHEHHHEDQQIPDDHDLDEEDTEEDAEMVEDPEVHGAPIYESAAARSGISGEKEDAHKEPRVVVVSPSTEGYENRGSESSGTFVGEGKVNLERPMGLVEDPTLAPHTASNYQSKVTDPTGAGPAEIDVTLVQKSFASMNVHDEPEPDVLLPTPTRAPTPTATVRTQNPSETNTQYLAASEGGVHTQNPSEINTQYPAASEGTHEEQRHYESMEKPSNQSSYADNTQYPAASEGSHEEQKHYESMEKPSNQSSYTDKISSATSAITDKAVTAKNVVASKLGYGDDKPATIATPEDQGKSEGAKASTMSGTATEYGKKIAGSLTDKLAPVYGTVAGVGSAVKSKVSGTTNGADNGVSMKDYLAEKLRPGDEDRALSEVISETLHKRKEEPITGDEEAEKTEHRRLGKVTESEGVKRRLGSVEENRGSQESFANSSEKGVVDKLKDVVGSWFGTTGENQLSQSQEGEGLSKNSGAEAGLVSQGAGERRLLESSN